mmetsp:Transcript_17672/g.50626  ORF Transcript_17672/g.50626 Transcript_17672/m.50626 type:complete len:478 (+) Transcript_17672:152-1585(+)
MAECESKQETKNCGAGGVDGPPLADGRYDVILLGSNAKHCILAWRLQMAGLSCLVVDENFFYGGDSASLRPADLAKLSNQTLPELEALKSAAFAIDLAPKLILARGNLVQLLLESQTEEYLEFGALSGSFVQHNGKPVKAPATSVEAAKTPLVSMMQKRKLRSFIKAYLEQEQETRDTPQAQTAKELFDQAGLSDATQAFIGHVLALRPDDSFLTEPAGNVLDSLRLYARSLSVTGQSPFVYPKYGIGTIAEAFSRRSALAGATYMLGTPVDAVEAGPKSEANQGARIVADGCVATAELIVSDPAYRAAFPFGTSKLLGPPVRIHRRIWIMDRHPACFASRMSAQIIIPQSETGRQHDIYVVALNGDHRVCPPHLHICVAATVADENASADQLGAADALVGSEGIVCRFSFEYKAFLRPQHPPAGTPWLFSASEDATSHFESMMADVDRLTRSVLERMGRSGEGDPSPESVSRVAKK